MRRHLSVFGIVVLVAFVAIAMLSPVSADEGKRTYLGATKCKTCHKSAAQGEQYSKWLESSHAKAYEVLASDEAKAVAKEKGIADAQKADECLKCHVTGHGVAAELLGPKYDVAEGVGCESCHGAGGDYYKKKTMVAITTGEIDGATVGLIKPNEKNCTGCHNEESPTFKGFDFEKMVAKIAHPIPDERKAKYKEGAAD